MTHAGNHPLYSLALFDPLLRRLSYHPETAQKEMANLRQLLPKAQAAITAISSTFSSHLEDFIKRLSTSQWHAADMDMAAEKQRRLDAMARAQRLLSEASK